MEEGRPSRTAWRVAMRRAAHQIFDIPPVFADPLALQIVEGQTPANDSPSLRAFMAVRSRYSDDQLAAAVERGVVQCVVLGAGLDTFAYRNPYAGLRVFEVDHPATQAWKRQLLEHTGIAIPDSLTFVPVDFETQTLRDGLERGGFRFDRLTFFSWLGVVPYLTGEAFESTLRLIASMPEGSAVVFDYGATRDSLGPREQEARDALSARVAAAGEPFKLFLDPGALAACLQSIGFTAQEDLNATGLNARYFQDRADGLRLMGTGGHVLSAQVGGIT
ncbi:MAG TPA: class I SAM-dependent methyltransferase [Bryobacteraceae bacterium]|jgi:methyltransferase (TIGR00027 family)|nr:class I SAM-dependent methyltransferase [Bryobacteraceae bacterium]